MKIYSILKNGIDEVFMISDKINIHNGEQMQVDLEDIIKHYKLKANEGFLYCLYEAISNSLYSYDDNATEIDIRICITRSYPSNSVISTESKDNFIKSVAITDTGKGMTDNNFTLFSNKLYKTDHQGGQGCGRIAFVKIFNSVTIDSYFYDEQHDFYHRKFKFDDNIEPTKDKISNIACSQGTTVILSDMNDEFISYASKYTVSDCSTFILKHFYIFLHYLLENGRKFAITVYDANKSAEKVIINNQTLEQDRILTEKFTLKELNQEYTFDVIHIKTSNLKENNAFYIVDERSAGVINNIDLPSKTLLEDQQGHKYSYQVYVRSDGYFKQFLNDSRTELNIPPKNKDSNLQLIYREDIEEKVKTRVEEHLKYELTKIKESKLQKIKNILTKTDKQQIINNSNYLYLLENEETKEELIKTINSNANDKDIIKQVQNLHLEVKIRTASKINDFVLRIQQTKTKSEVDIEKIKTEIIKFAQQVNIENAVELSSYIMYRKYILNLLKSGLDTYMDNQKQDEKFFHNLLLPKGYNNDLDSNLWLIDDQFLYFNSNSETRIKDIQINGEKIIRELNENETDEIDSFNKKRLDNRTDLLFFPEEKKCIIIELKAPNVGLDEQVFQMDRYVKMIANFVKPKFKIEQFYTYFITDNFNSKYDKPTGYRKIYGLDCFVRNSLDIVDFETEETIANQYSEVIRYTDIYTRAKRRNDVFFHKLNIKI